MIGCFVDVGSTFTKVRLIDVETGELLGSTQSSTTVDTDVMIGLEDALDTLEDETGIDRKAFDLTLASSSAAGGLRVLIVGFSPKYTLAAGQRAALGAGAKIADTYTWYLDDDDLDSIRAHAPDLILLTGGTDGGNERALLKNAEKLSSIDQSCPVIVAGNADAAPEAQTVLEDNGFSVTVAENVLASGDGDLQVADVREKIRQTFLHHIVDAKGLEKVRAFADNDIVPTPDAISDICELLGTGTETEGGFGELLAVDIGGATTDLHSIGHGDPTKPYVKPAENLEEPFRKRTVEGDLGIRYNASTIRSLFGTNAIGEHSGRSVEEAAIDRYVDKVSAETEWIPTSDVEEAIDVGLAGVATAVAAERHAGTLERVQGGERETFAGAGEAAEVTGDVGHGSARMGPQDRLPTKYEQVGKDLTEFSAVIGTGGILVNTPRPLGILEQVQEAEGSNTLLPASPTHYLDEQYILFACGLLAKSHPEEALRTVKRNLTELS